MSLLSRWRKAVKPKTKALAEVAVTAPKPVGTRKDCCENTVHIGSTPRSTVEYFSSDDEDIGLSKTRSDTGLRNGGGKELKRSETFTLKDGPPDDVFYEAGSGIYTNYGTYKKDKHAHVETDVFETLYTKRPSKSSRSSRSSSGSASGYTNDPAPPATVRTLSRTPSVPTVPAIISPPSISSRISYFSRNPVVPSASKHNAPSNQLNRPFVGKATEITRPTHISRHSSLVTPATGSQTQRKTTVISVNGPAVKPAKAKSPVCAKPREYLFGTDDRHSKKIDKNKDNHDTDDRFKTITLKDVRRSFREKYMTAENRASTQHQPLWFVDVNEKKSNQLASHNDVESLADRDSTAYTRSMYMEFDPPARPSNNAAVRRKDTFKVIRNDSNYTTDEEYHRRPAAGSSTLKRRETFKVDDPIQIRFVSTDTQQPLSSTQERNRRNLDAIRVDLNAVRDHRALKIVPVGIATPYSSQNDIYDTNYGGRKRYSWSRQRNVSSPSSSSDHPDGRYVFDQPLTKNTNIDRGTWTRKAHRNGVTSIASRRDGDLHGTVKKPIESLRSRWDVSQRKHEPMRVKHPHQGQSVPDLGFEKFYDPNYIVPKNRNAVYGSNEPNYRSVNLKVMPKPRESSIRSNPNNWIYNQVHV